MHSSKVMNDAYTLNAYSCLLTLYRFLRAKLYFSAAAGYLMQEYPNQWDNLISPRLYNRVKGSMFQTLYSNTTFPRSVWGYLTLFKIHYTVISDEYPALPALIRFYDPAIRMLVINPYYLVNFGKQLGAETVEEYATALHLPTHSTLLRCITMQTLIPRWPLIASLLEAGAVFGSLFVTGIEAPVFVERVEQYKSAMQGEVLDFSVTERGHILPFILQFFEGAEDETNSIFGLTRT